MLVWVALDIWHGRFCNQEAKFPKTRLMYTTCRYVRLNYYCVPCLVKSRRFVGQTYGWPHLQRTCRAAAQSKKCYVKIPNFPESVHFLKILCPACIPFYLFLITLELHVYMRRNNCIALFTFVSWCDYVSLVPNGI